MKFWTIQTKTVLEIIEKEGIYYPDFSRSQYYKQCSDLYDEFLKSFNYINNTKCKGLIYSFAVSNNGTIYGIEKFEIFRGLINRNKDKVEYLWNTFIETDCKIIELELDLDFNDLALGFNQFQYIMPSAVNKLLFEPEEYKINCNVILSNIQEGILMSSSEPWDLIQSHLPCIKKSDIKNIYEIFHLN